MSMWTGTPFSREKIVLTLNDELLVQTGRPLITLDLSFLPIHDYDHSSTMDAVNNVGHPTLDDQDESVRIAVRALGDMRNSVHASPSTCKSFVSYAPSCRPSHAD